MTGKRMNLLKIYAQFPPMRKWMDALPVHNQHPSCLHPLSRGEVVGWIWVLEDCYCFTHGRSAHSLACVVQREPETDSPSPLQKKAKYLTLPAFVILF